MSGFLDFLDSPDLMSQILGGGAGVGADGGQVRGLPPMPPQAAPPSPPPQPAAAPPVSTSPGQTPDFNGGATPGLPMPAPGGMNAPSGVSGPGSSSFDEGGFNAGSPGAGAGALAQVPMPPPRPSQLQPPMPPSAQQPLAPPLNLAPPSAPPMPPQMPAGSAPPTQSAGGGLAAAFGLDPNRVRAAMAGVGKGLYAVGSARPGAPAGQVFAAGAGGSLQGAADAQQKQKDALFNQSSTAFKDMLAAKNSDDTSAYRKAQSQYLAARSASLATMTANGGKGSAAWQNTPYGKVIQVENESQKYEKGQQILLQKRWTLNGATPEQQQQDLDKLNKNVDAYRNRLYGQAGIDPKQADKIKDMGTSATNAFDTKGMSSDQFHTQVPMGAWFRTDKGVFQRTVPPPGAANAQSAAPSTAVNLDDQAAMTPAA